MNKMKRNIFLILSLVVVCAVLVFANCTEEAAHSDSGNNSTTTTVTDIVISPEGGYFYPTQEITINVTNATSAKYTIDSTDDAKDGISFNKTTTFTIGDDMDDEDSTIIRVYAWNSKGEKVSSSAEFMKKGVVETTFTAKVVIDRNLSSESSYEYLADATVNDIGAIRVRTASGKWSLLNQNPEIDSFFTKASGDVEILSADVTSCIVSVKASFPEGDNWVQLFAYTKKTKGLLLSMMEDPYFNINVTKSVPSITLDVTLDSIYGNMAAEFKPQN